MTINVLCPGPSVAAFVPNGLTTIGVNRAVQAHRCDWWACSDYPMLRDYDAGYLVKLFTGRDTKIIRPERFTEVLLKEDIPHFNYTHTPACPWGKFTATSALVLAAHLGAKRIDVWGVDWKGISDWDGHEYSWVGNEAWRTRSKWDDQILEWNRTVQMIGETGVEVTRHGIA